MGGNLKSIQFYCSYCESIFVNIVSNSKKQKSDLTKQKLKRKHLEKIFSRTQQYKVNVIQYIEVQVILLSFKVLCSVVI